MKVIDCVRNLKVGQITFAKVDSDPDPFSSFFSDLQPTFAENQIRLFPMPLCLVCFTCAGSLHFLPFSLSTPFKPSLRGVSRRTVTATQKTPVQKALDVSDVSVTSSPSLLALRDFYLKANALPHSGTCAHFLGRAASAQVDEARRFLKTYYHFPSITQLHFFPSILSISITFFRSFVRTLSPNDEIIISGLECDAVALPLREICKCARIRVRDVREKGSGKLMQSIARLLRSKTRLIVLTPANASSGGMLEEFDSVFELAAAAGVPILMDMCEMMAYEKVTWNGGSIIGGGWQMGVPGGGGFLYLHEDIGLEMETDVSGVGIAGAVAAAVDETKTCSWRQLGEKLRKVVVSVVGVKLIEGPWAVEAIPAVCFEVECMEAKEVLVELRKREVNVSLGWHGSRALHEALGFPLGSLRVEVKDDEDVERFKEALMALFSDRNG